MYLDAIIIGAGFSGLYQLHQCRDQIGLKSLIIEEGKEVGGTWYWNKYPGSRCDTESHIYCYTFSKEIYKNWKWKDWNISWSSSKPSSKNNGSKLDCAKFSNFENL